MKERKRRGEQENEEMRKVEREKGGKDDRRTMRGERGTGGQESEERRKIVKGKRTGKR